MPLNSRVRLRPQAGRVNRHHAELACGAFHSGRFARGFSREVKAFAWPTGCEPPARASASAWICSSGCLKQVQGQALGPCEAIPATSNWSSTGQWAGEAASETACDWPDILGAASGRFRMGAVLFWPSLDRSSVMVVPSPVLPCRCRRRSSRAVSAGFRCLLIWASERLAVPSGGA